MRTAGLFVLPWLLGAPAVAQPGPASLCRAAIAAAEAGTRIPDAFLSAIGRVESGRADADGAVAPWPWTVNAQGQGHFYDTKAEAVAAVQAFQAQGVRSIDVGCLQVNLAQHPDAFASLEQAFDPAANAAYAARFLQSLFAQTGSWPLAAAAYHSQTPGIGADYQRKVLSEWAVPDRPGRRPPLTATAKAPAILATLAPEAAPEAAPGVGAALPAGGLVRVLRLPGAGAATSTTGRDLAAYRRLPVRLASVFRPR